MGTRRTRKQKEQAKFHFNYTWEKPKSGLSPATSVKRQSKSPANEPEPEKTASKNAEFMGQESTNDSAKKNILRSLLFAGCILGIELVIYLAWK